MKKQKTSLAQKMAEDLGHWMRSPERPHNESYRNYLGMSSIGGCARAAYWSVLDPEESDALFWYSWSGYMHEDAGIELLRGAGFTIETPDQGYEIVADFDERYRGHPDGFLSHEGRRILLEMKSVTYDKYCQRLDERRPTSAHFDQVQAYMSHDPHGFDGAVICYMARDIPYREFKLDWATWDVPFPGFYLAWVAPEPAHQAKLNIRAQGILAAIDRRQPPPCDCGWCRR